MKTLLASAVLLALQLNVAYAQDEQSAEGASAAQAETEQAPAETPEPAAEEEAGPFATTLTFVSDYRFRGISQTLEDPVIQADLKYTHGSGVYASVWASDVKFLPPAKVGYEFDTTIGWAGNLSDDVGLDLSLTRYNYPVDSPEADYAELVGKVMYAGLTATVGYSNDVLNTSETGIYYNLGYGLTVADAYNVSASVGYYDLTDSFDGTYTDYSVGVSRTFGDLTVGFSYVNTNDGLEGLFGQTNDSRFVFSMSKTIHY